MRINGMTMRNYWTVNYVFNFLLYLVSSSSLVIFGIWSDISFFTETNRTILAKMILYWGLNQVSISFFLSCFISKSQNASMIGYVFSSVTSVMTSTLMVTSKIY
mmetsp:Transcript_5690/g.9782  ORF Transcript_5690/g.9782 Transcript_5690/m.9782 type:complete len:104 (+) Transcript_5690:1099-1410(+)